MPKFSAFAPQIEEAANRARTLNIVNDMLRENPLTQDLAHSEEEICAIMEECGAGLRETLGNLASLQRDSSSGIRLQAVRTSLEAMGKLGKRKEEKRESGIQINIISENANLNSVFNPQRT